jgi:hypothetical protein
MRLEKFFEFRKKDLEPIKSFYIKDELNPKIWNDFKMDSEIRKDLLKIGNDFFNNVEIECDVKDIVLCGSLCNYNWSEKYSDFDIHVIIKYTDVNKDFELVEKLCDYAKKQWNMQYDIKLRGYEVEVMLQDKDSLYDGIKSGKMGGVFSLMNNKWIKKPERVEFVPDEETLKKKATSIMDVIDEIESNIDKDSYSSLKSKITSIWKKIKKYRQSGLEEGGEYSTGNLLFKLLRRNNYLQKIMDLKRYAYSKQFESINEWYDDVILNFFYELDRMDHILSEESNESWSEYINYEYDEDRRIITVNMGGHGYSGYNRTLKIDFSDIEYITVEENESHSGPYGSFKNEDKMKFNSFNELLNYIKEL